MSNLKKISIMKKLLVRTMLAVGFVLAWNNVGGWVDLVSLALMSGGLYLHLKWNNWKFENL